MIKTFRILAAVGTIIIIGVLLFKYLMYWSPKAQKSWENVENVKKVEQGMLASEVLKIMGEPDVIMDTEDANRGRKYYYAPPFLASDGIYIEMNNQDRVEQIVQYE